MPFYDNNIADGVSPNSNFKVGRSDIDAGELIEQGIDLPWATNPAGSYVYYDCTVMVVLDSGIVVHNRLPQVDRTADTLAATFIGDADQDTITDAGVNLRSNDQFEDIVQRMGHSRYWFRLFGQAIRVGYKVPIPGIKMIGGRAAIPYDRNPQWAYNTICPGGNYGGIPLWRAAWSLWYTVASAPISDSIPVADLAGHIRGDARLPDTIQPPFSTVDDEAVTAGFPLQGKVR